MMMTFDIDATFAEQRRDRVSDVDKRIDRGDRHVAFLRANVIAEVRIVKRAFASRVPMPFFGIYRVPGRILVVVIAGLVKNKEFGFGPEMSSVRNSGKFQIALGTDRDRSDRKSVV